MNKKLIIIIFIAIILTIELYIIKKQNEILTNKLNDFICNINRDNCKKAVTKFLYERHGGMYSLEEIVNSSNYLKQHVTCPSGGKYKVNVHASSGDQCGEIEIKCSYHSIIPIRNYLYNIDENNPSRLEYECKHNINRLASNLRYYKNNITKPNFKNNIITIRNYFDIYVKSISGERIYHIIVDPCPQGGNYIVYISNNTNESYLKCSKHDINSLYGSKFTY